MSIPLKKYQADWIAEQVSAGRYETELDVIEDAIATKMREDEAAWAADGEKLRERFLLSLDDIKHGRTVVADEAFWESKRQMIRDRYMKPQK